MGVPVIFTCEICPREPPLKEKNPITRIKAPSDTSCEKNMETNIQLHICFRHTLSKTIFTTHRYYKSPDRTSSLQELNDRVWGLVCHCRRTFLFVVPTAVHPWMPQLLPMYAPLHYQRNPKNRSTKMKSVLFCQCLPMLNLNFLTLYHTFIW